MVVVSESYILLVFFSTIFFKTYIYHTYMQLHIQYNKHIKVA